MEIGGNTARDLWLALQWMKTLYHEDSGFPRNLNENLKFQIMLKFSERENMVPAKSLSA